MKDALSDRDGMEDGMESESEILGDAAALSFQLTVLRERIRSQMLSALFAGAVALGLLVLFSPLLFAATPFAPELGRFLPAISVVLCFIAGSAAFQLLKLLEAARETRAALAYLDNAKQEVLRFLKAESSQ